MLAGSELSDREHLLDLSSAGAECVAVFCHTPNVKFGATLRRSIGRRGIASLRQTGSASAPGDHPVKVAAIANSGACRYST